MTFSAIAQGKPRRLLSGGEKRKVIYRPGGNGEQHDDINRQ
jgi:hypothetical protein